jgi:hypothetical protein
MATCNGLVNKEACYDTAFQGKCEWAQVGTTKPPTTDPSTGPTPLFTKEFCHPIEVAGTKMTKDQWYQCIEKSSKDECNSNVNVCSWSNGAVFVPEEDFCAPQFMTKDWGIVDKCTETKDKEACVDKCKWYKGKVVKPSQKDFVSGADLFGANFCHPPTANGW